MEIWNTEPTVETIKAICILDNDGKRIACKYYDNVFPNLKDQQKFEEKLFTKTHRANSEIAMLEGITAVYRSNVDLFFYVIGAQSENELLLLGVLNGLYETLSQLLKRNVEKQSLFEHMDAVLLLLDELVDGGIVMETDPGVLLQRIAVKTEEGFSEQTVTQALQSARETLRWSLLKS